MTVPIASGIARTPTASARSGGPANSTRPSSGTRLTITRARALFMRERCISTAATTPPPISTKGTMLVPPLDCDSLAIRRTSSFMAPVLRSRIGSTNSDRSVERRQFIRTAAGSAAGIVLGGPPLLTACTSTDSGVSVVSGRHEVTTVPQTTGSTATTLPADTTAPPTTSGIDNNVAATVWRLSTRNQRAACAACKAHAAHRYFASDAFADAGRAHAGCSCEIREQPTTVGQLQTWFAADDEVFDDRWVT